MQLAGAAPGLHNVYAPAYHVAGGLLLPWLGAAITVKLLAFASAAALIAGFRSFQRAAGLPDACAALFAWAPYGFALSWCLPKVEAAGYALAFFGLGLVWRRRPAGLALVLAATFAVHTAAALFLGLAGGVAALALRDRRSLAALAAGALLASPLLALHLAAGCSPAEALLFSRGDYLRSPEGWSSLPLAGRIAALASPPALLLAAVGAPQLWRRHRAVAILGLLVLVLCTNELWLAPFGLRTTLNLLRGLTLLALPVAAAAGVALAGRPRSEVAWVSVCAVWALGCAWLALPGSCHREPLPLARVDAIVLDRCHFRWAFSDSR